jgi:hypothetical protein
MLCQRRSNLGSAFDRDGTISRRSLSGISGRLFGRARRLLLAGHDLVDGPRHLLLTGGDLVDALQHRVDLERHCVKLLIGGRRDQRVRLGSFLRDGFGLRRQPAKLRVRVCDYLSRRVAIRLPGQGGCYTDAKRHQETGEGARSSLADWRLSVRQRIIFKGRRANRRWIG